MVSNIDGTKLCVIMYKLYEFVGDGGGNVADGAAVGIDRK